MATKLYDYENRLIAADEDQCAVWSRDAKAWKRCGAELAREAWLGGKELSVAQATAKYPNVDVPPNFPEGA